MACPDEDIRLYARGFYGRYRETAYARAMERSQELGGQDDLEGVAVWHRVAHEIRRLAANDGRGRD